MDTKKYAILFLLIVSGLLNVQLQCNKRIGCAESSYGFELGIKAYPDRDSIHVGDTLWLEINEPTTLKDVQTGRMIDYSGAENLGTAIGIAEISSVNNINTEGNVFLIFIHSWVNNYLVLIQTNSGNSGLLKQASDINLR